MKSLLHLCGMIAFIMWFAYTIFALPYFILGVGPLFTTKLVSMSNRKCYEEHGVLYAEQFIMITGNITAMFNCGPVISCLGSPCYIGVSSPGDIVYIVGQNGPYYGVSDYSIYVLTVLMHVAINLILFVAILSTVGCIIAIKHHRTAYVDIVDDNTNLTLSN